jgi:predicted GNAT family N-acyltransferase
MAVAEDCRGRGFGAGVISRIEHEARSQGVKVLLLHSRESAVLFYERLGFFGEGEFFFEIGIPHLRMRKPLFDS